MGRVAPVRSALLTLAGVALITVVIGVIEARGHIANISMLYLIVVLAAATFGGRGAAVVASVASFLAYNWFFVQPQHTFQVGDPDEWFALVLFLITAAITGHLAALVDDVLGRMRAQTAGHAVHVDIPDDLPPVPLDYVEIDQVLSNLLENAVRHTPQGTTVWIRARVADDELRVSVSDDGPGIGDDVRARLFDAFVRGGDRRGAQGAGLGLAIAR